MDRKTFIEHIENDTLHTLPRTEFRTNLNQFYYDIRNKLLPRKFLLFLLRLEIKKALSKKGYATVLNKFPYGKLLKNTGLKHYVVWFRNDPTGIKTELRKRYGECYFYTSKQEHKSVPEIDHFHMFCK